MPTESDYESATLPLSQGELTAGISPALNIR